MLHRSPHPIHRHGVTFGGAVCFLLSQASVPSPQGIVALFWRLPTCGPISGFLESSGGWQVLEHREQVSSIQAMQ